MPNSRMPGVSATQPPAAGKRVENVVVWRPFWFFSPISDVAQPQPRLDGVEQARLAHARRPRHHAHLARQRGAERVDAEPGRGAGYEHGVAEPLVEPLPEGDGVLGARLAFQ